MQEVFFFQKIPLQKTNGVSILFQIKQKSFQWGEIYLHERMIALLHLDANQIMKLINQFW